MSYWVKVRYNGTGKEEVIERESAFLRALEIIMLSPYVVVLEQGEKCRKCP